MRRMGGFFLGNDRSNAVITQRSLNLNLNVALSAI